MLTKSKFATLVIVSAAVIVLGVVNLYYIRDDGAISVFWKGGEAYLFLGTGHSGYHFSYLEFPLKAMNEYFHSPTLPNNKSGSITLIHVTPSSVESHILAHGTSAAFLTPFEDGFYAMCNGGNLCKLRATGFEPATQAESARFGGVDRLVPLTNDSKSVSGWNVRHLGSSPGNHFEVSADGQFGISGRNNATKPGEDPNYSIELVRPGQTPETLYKVNAAPRKVSKREYQSIFADRQ